MKNLSKTAESICQDLREYQLDLLDHEANVIDLKKKSARIFNDDLDEAIIIKQLFENELEKIYQKIQETNDMIDLIINH